MPNFRGRYNYDTTIEGSFEGVAESQDQFEFDLMNEVRDLDPAARNINVLDIVEVVD